MPNNNMSNDIRESKDLLKQEIKRMEQIKSRSSEQEKYLSDLRTTLRMEELQREADERAALEKRLHEARVKQLGEEGKYQEQIAAQVKEKYTKDIGSTFTKAAVAASNIITSKLNPYIDSYVSNLQSLGAHLSGTGKSLSGITDLLNNTLTGQGLISQKSVFDNLTQYVKSGIVYNVEQRAFLKTIADDISLTFDSWTSSMNQLVRIQGQDSTANRLALEYSLQEFLNQNYKTSEYLADAFSNVSNSLLTAQSTMNQTTAMQFEGIVQSWLGSMYSAGMNSGTINSLAEAINQLGSGDISGLGSGISNLVILGAARAGLDYGALLHGGLNENTTDKLLAGITSYMQEMGSYDSNIIRSQIGNIFGVNITDLIAAGNMRNTGGSVSTDISNLLGDVAGFTPFSVKFNNMLDNLMFSWGTNIASVPLHYGAYQIENIAAGILGTILDDVKIGGDGGILPFEIDLGNLAAATPLITLFPTLIETLIGDAFPSLISGVGGLTGIFNSLGSAASGSVIKMSDIGVSGSAYLGNTSSTSDLLSGSLLGLHDLTAGVVEQEGPTLEENVTTITDTVVNILDLLTERLESIDDAVNTLALSDNVISAGMTIINKGVSF